MTQAAVAECASYSCFVCAWEIGRVNALRLYFWRQRLLSARTSSESCNASDILELVGG